MLTVTMGSTTLHMFSVNHLTQPPLSPSRFQAVFNTLEGLSSGEGVLLTLRGDDAVASKQVVMLSLALPVSLHNGDVYTVGSTFNVEPDAESDVKYGPYDLAQPNQAEAAFTESTYTFPDYAVNFRAVTSTGTIRVTNRASGQAELTLNLSFTDATGNTATVIGRVLAINESFKARCN